MFIRTERSVKEFLYAYPVVSILVIINVVLWLITGPLNLEIGNTILLWGIGQNYSIYTYGEYWRFITPIFLHANLMHALFNSFSLVLFGPALEQMIGKNKFIVGYLLAGIAGNIGTYLVDPISTTFHVGASGAIYGLFGIYIFMVFFRKHLIDQGNAQIVITIFVIGIIMTFINPAINKSAHVFGFIGGFAMGPPLLIGAQPFSIYRNRRPRTQSRRTRTVNPHHQRRRLISRQTKINTMWIIIGILVILGIFGRLF